MARVGHLGAGLTTCALVLAACGGDGRELADPVLGLSATASLETLPPSLPATLPAEPVASTAVPAPVPDPTRPTADGRVIEIDELYSPANATAEMLGTGAEASDPVTVDGEPADVLSFRASDSGVFAVRVWIEDEGAHTVCVADACGRVYTLAPDAETPEEIIELIELAIPLAQEYLDWSVLFPEWTVEIGGALSGTGGTTDLDTKTVNVYRNRGRSIDDFVRTILHEFGHVADFERLGDDARAEYLAVRGIDTSVPWRETVTHGIDAWGRQPSEDFAEVMVMIWSEGRWLPRTEVADVPGLDQLEAVLALVEPPVG